MQPRVKPGVAVAIVRDCLAALAALHREGLVHGDIKPSNLMLKLTGNAKLVDIGAAFELNKPPPQRMCTPTYAAPEVLEGVGVYAAERSGFARLRSRRVARRATTLRRTDQLAGTSGSEAVSTAAVARNPAGRGDLQPIADELLQPLDCDRPHPTIPLSRGCEHAKAPPVFTAN